MYLTYVSVTFTTENLKAMPEKREMAEVPDGKMCTNKQKSERGGQAQSRIRLLVLLVQQNPSCYC